MSRIVMLSLAAVFFAPLAPQGCPLLGPEPADDVSTERPLIPTTAESDVLQANVGDTVQLLGSAQSASQVRYSWTQIGGAGVTLKNADQANARFAAPSVDERQTLRFVVTTTNADGGHGQAEATVTVQADPEYGKYTFDNLDGGGGQTVTAAPQADAGADQQAVPGETVSLDGSESEGQSLSYSWRQTAGRTVSLTDAGTAVAQFVAPLYRADGDNAYTFRVRVTDARNRTSTDEVTVTVLNPDTVGPRVQVVTTLGAFSIELYPEEAPETVENFLEYVDDQFYDNTLFHRVIPGFVVQGGGFTPGLSDKDTRDPIPNESDNGLENDRGTLAMARTTDPDSATSQFYVNLVDNDSLNAQPGRPGYTVFGRVFNGMEVVDRIAQVPTESRSGFDDVPVVDVVIKSMRRID